MLAPTVASPTVSDDVRDSIIENSYKAIADKIWDILDKVRDKTATAPRRWIWELMQNAKDTPNSHKQVSIRVELTADALLFAHNGDAFEVKNLTSLVQQVSRKDSTNAQEDVTGKFGTGFISTHMLADQIEVQGVVKRPGDLRRAFQLVLDRRASKPEDLVEPIKKALERVQQLDDETQFALLPDYEAKRVAQEDVLDTLFRYPLGAEKPESSQWKAARQGLKDLEVTLPATLVNIPHIKQVTVSRDGQVRLYRCQKLEALDGVERYVVDVLNERGQVVTSRSFLAFEQGDLRLLAEVKSFEDLTLLPEPGGKPVPKEERTPTLFRDFPLVGSDTYQLPFQLHGKTFHPQEARDGLWLNEGNKAKHNRELLQQAVPAALTFSQWLVEHQAKNLYRLAFTRVPMEAQLDLAAQQWYRDHVQRPWRGGLLDLNLVETAAGGRTNLRLARVPRYRAQNFDKKQNRDFGELVSAFLGADRVPNLDLLDEWIEALGVDGDLKEYATWDQPIFLDLAGLFKLVAAAGRVENLPVAGGEAEKLTWLNKLFVFAEQQQQELGKLLKDHAVVPNQRGELRNLHEDKLNAERQEDYIPVQVLEVLKQLGVDWPVQLMHRQVVLPGQDGEKLGLKDAAGEITKRLTATEKTPGQALTSFLDRTDVEPLKVLTRLLSLTTTGAKENSVRRRLVQFAADVLKFEPTLEMVAEGTRLNENLEYTFEAAESLLARLINQQLEELQDLGQLQVQLGRDRDATLQWLDEYVGLLEGSSKHKELLTKGGRLLPNWEDELKPYAELHNFGTEDQQKNKAALRPLVGQLASLATDEADKWQGRLLAEGISLRVPLTLSFEQLGAKLTARTEAIRAKNDDDEHRAYRSVLMALIEWCHAHRDDNLADQYLRLFALSAGRTFYLLNVELNGNSAMVMKILKQSTQQLTQLAALSEMELSDKTLDKVLAHARLLSEQAKAEKTNFDTGRQVEKLFMKALEGTGLVGKMNFHYQGSGDCDYVVSNEDGTIEFHLEVKSYLEGTEKYPLHIALSQATTASKKPDNFALCVVSRPENLDEMLPEDVAERMKYVPVHDAGFAHVVENWGKLENIAYEDAAADMRLEVEFATSRVRMSHKLVDKLKKGAEGQGLYELVEVVKARLGIVTPSAEEPVAAEL